MEGFIGYQPGKIASEALTFLSRAAFKTEIRNTPDTGGSVNAAAVAITGSADATFDLTGGKELTFHYSENTGTSYRPITVNLAGGTVPAATTIDETVAALNANTMFTSVFVATKSTAKLVVTTRAKGPTVMVYITGTGVAIFGFAARDTVAEALAGSGTGVVAIETVTKDIFGKPVPAAKVKVSLYNAGTGATLDTTAIAQQVSSVVLSGGHTNEFVALTDKDGCLNFTVIDAATGANSVYVEFESGDSFPLVTLLKAARTKIDCQVSAG